MKNTIRVWASLLLLLTASCSFATRENASTLPFRMYGDGQINRAYMAWNASGSGEVWFDARDGERFVGEYTTIAPEVYQLDLSIFLSQSTWRYGRSRYASSRSSFSTARSNMQYGLASAAGDRGTTVVCKYTATVNQWSIGFSATGTCLDSKGKTYVLHASSQGRESANLKAAETKGPPPKAENDSPSTEAARSAQADQFAVFLGANPANTTKPVEGNYVEQRPAEPAKRKFYGNLVIYAGRVVPLGGGTATAVRAEFVEETPGHGSVRLIEPGNNVFDGRFTAKAPDDSATFRMITQKTVRQLKLSESDEWGVISASDRYGSLLECIYGTVALSKRRAGLCEDTRGNKYRLYFD